MAHPDEVRRRIVPDAVQLQVIVGSLLGDGRLEGEPGSRCLRIAHSVERAAYAWWKYERLGTLAAYAPAAGDGVVGFRTIAHPLFDDLARLPRGGWVALLTPLGLAVWMADVGRLELRADAFLPAQRTAALAG